MRLDGSDRLAVQPIIFELAAWGHDGILSKLGAASDLKSWRAPASDWGLGAC